MFLTIGNSHRWIPNSSVGTNSSETRRSLSLSLKKLTKLYEISNGFTRKDWVGVGFWDEHHLETFPSFYLDPLLTVRGFLRIKERENETTKTKSSRFIILAWISKSSRSHQFPHFQSLQENQSLQLKTFIFRVDFHRKSQTPHRLIVHVHTHKHISPLTYKSSIHQNH